MVLQLGNWRAGQNPTLPGMAVSQSVSLPVSPCGSQSMHRRAVTCCLGQTKLCGQHLLVAHFAAFCFWLTGSLREAGGGAVASWWRRALAAASTGCQSFVLQCPNYFIDLPSTFVQFGVLHTLRHPRASTRIRGHPWAEQATTLTSLISGMRGNVAIWQRQRQPQRERQRKGLSVFRAKRGHNDDGRSMHIHCPSPIARLTCGAPQTWFLIALIKMMITNTCRSER